MAEGREKLTLAIVTKLRTDTGVGSLVALTNHNAASVSGYRIVRDSPPKRGETPMLGISIRQSFPLLEDGPSEMQIARVHFHAYTTKDLTAIRIGDRLEHLLHARDEQDPGMDSITNVGHYDFSSVDIRNSQTRWKNTDEPDFNDETDVWEVVVEAQLIWHDTSCP